MNHLAFALLVLGIMAGVIYCVDRGHNWTAFGLFAIAMSVEMKTTTTKESEKK